MVLQFRALLLIWFLIFHFLLCSTRSLSCMTISRILMLRWRSLRTSRVIFPLRVTGVSACFFLIFLAVFIVLLWMLLALMVFLLVPLVLFSWLQSPVSVLWSRVLVLLRFLLSVLSS